MTLDPNTLEEETEARKLTLYRALISSLPFLLLVLLLGSAFIPYPTLLAPRWGVHVSDSEGRPMSGRLVREQYVDYRVGMQPEHEDRYTDGDGDVEFPAKYVRMGGAKRFIERVWTRTLPLAKVWDGPDDSVFVLRQIDERSDFDPSLSWNGKPDTMESYVVIRRSK